MRGRSLNGARTGVQGAEWDRKRRHSPYYKSVCHQNDFKAFFFFKVKQLDNVALKFRQTLFEGSIVLRNGDSFLDQNTVADLRC